MVVRSVSTMADANFPTEDVQGLIKALREKLVSILHLNPYYIARRDMLREQIDQAQLIASEQGGWNFVVTFFDLLAAVAYYDSARSEIPPADNNAPESAQIKALITQVYESIPLTDVTNNVAAFRAIEPLAMKEVRFGGNAMPQVRKVLSPFMIIRYLKDYSNYYAVSLPTLVATLTRGALAPFWRATREQLMAYIIMYYSADNYMLPSADENGPSPFTRFAALIHTHGAAAVENIVKRQEQFGVPTPTENIILELETKLAHVLLMGFIHKNRDAFLAAFPRPPIDVAPAIVTPLYTNIPPAAGRYNA